VRAHADVSPDFGLTCVEGVAQAREALRASSTCSSSRSRSTGVAGRAGTAELLEEAARGRPRRLRRGIDPEVFDGDPDGQLDLIFGLADRYGIGGTCTCTIAAGRPRRFEGVVAREGAVPPGPGHRQPLGSRWSTSPVPTWTVGAPTWRRPESG